MEHPTCGVCSSEITFKPVLATPEQAYHIECFKCKMCKLQLPGPHVLETSDKSLWCHPCHEAHNPKCPKCDKTVLGPGVPTKSGPAYHPGCFVCSCCNCELRDEYFGTTHEDFKCEKCASLPVCTVCQSPIKGKEDESKYYVCMGESYHEMCFTCVKCDLPMSEDLKPKLSRDKQQLLCEPCYTAEAPVCAKCGEPCMDSFVPIQEEDSATKYYHEGCVLCKSCDKQITDGEMLWRKPDGFLCNACQVSQAPKCKLCAAPVVQRQVVVEDDIYHPDCFPCLDCHKPGDEGVYYKDGDKEGYRCSQCHDGGAGAGGGDSKPQFEFTAVGVKKESDGDLDVVKVSVSNDGVDAVHVSVEVEQ